MYRQWKYHRGEPTISKETPAAILTVESEITTLPTMLSKMNWMSITTPVTVIISDTKATT